MDLSAKSTQNKTFQKGFTLIESVVAIMIFLTLMGIATVSVLTSRQKAQSNTTLKTIITDLRQQQIKAMVGSTEGSQVGSYGIFFWANSYTLFHGSAYNPADPSNSVVNLGEGVSITNILFPQSLVIFATRSGEIVNYSSGSDSITVTTFSTGENKVVRLNQYGVVVQAN